MNKYEAYMKSKQVKAPQDPKSFADYLRTAYRIERIVAAVERLTSPTTEPMPGLSTWVTREPETRDRSQYRIDQERAQNHDPFRAYLGYGQGLRRRS